MKTDGTENMEYELNPVPQKISAIDPENQKYDDTLEKGNSDGNLANQGLVALKGDWIYYSNQSDGRKLYKMKTDGTEKTKVMEGYLLNISIVGNWIFYSPGGAILRIRTDGTERTRLENSSSSNINAADGWIYFTNDTQGSNIYKIRTSGGDKTKLTEDKCYMMNVSGEWIYYIVIKEPVGKWEMYRIKNDGTGRVLVD